MRTARRLVVPLGMVFGTLICAYLAFFVGIKDDLPQPSGAERYPLSISKQITVANQWPETLELKERDASVFTLRENPQKAADFYREAFVTKRGWKEITAPGQPKEHGPDQQFIMLGFSRGNSRVYLGLSQGKYIYSSDNELNKALRSNTIKENDNIAVLVTGTVK